MSGWVPRNEEIMTVPRIPSSKLTAKHSSVPMNVTRQTRTGMVYQRGARAEGVGVITSSILRVRSVEFDPPTLSGDCLIDLGLHSAKPRRGERMQPTAQAVGKRKVISTSPGGGERSPPQVTELNRPLPRTEMWLSPPPG